MIKTGDVYSNSMKDLTFIDLFSGMGAFSLALESFGAKCVLACDKDPDARRVYRRNFGMQPKKDVCKLKSLPPHDILCAGFPCQPFSISGNKLGFGDTRGTLFFELMRLARKSKPMILFFENVPNIEGHDDGRTYIAIIKLMEKAGYDVYTSVLRASYFGLPTQRDRMYFVAFRKDMNVKAFRFPGQTRKYKPLKAFMLQKAPKQYYLRTDREIVLKNRAIQHTWFGEYPRKLIQLGYVGTPAQANRIYSVNGHARTLVALAGGGGAKTGWYKTDNGIRTLTPRECASVMGFPKRYQILKDKNTMLRLVGNSIPVNVLQYVVKEICDTFERRA
jgi:DNA (cytosine-5)-methyltransferase 1